MSAGRLRRSVSVFVVLVVTSLLLAPGRASAAPIVIEPDDFAAGTNISAVFSGITLMAVGGGFGAGASIFAVNPFLQPNEPFTASTGSLTFGTDSASFPHLFREPGFLNLRVDFATPANSVSIDFISNDGADTGFLQALNAANVLLGTYTTASLPQNAFETMTVGGGNIAYVLAGGLDGGSSGGLDRLVYEQTIPEPATLLLLATGAVLLRCRRRMAAGRRS